MPKIKAYRYDDEDYDDGELIRSRADCFDALTTHQQVVEGVIRATVPNGRDIRSTSVYTWENEMIATRLWGLSRKKHLYELEIDASNIRLRGDLNCYSAAIDAVKAGKAPEEDVHNYCSGKEAGPPFEEPRIEVLVSEARVIRKLLTRS